MTEDKELHLTAARCFYAKQPQVASLPHVVHKIEVFLFNVEASQWTLESASERGHLGLLDRLLANEWPGFSPRCREKRLSCNIESAAKNGYDGSILQWWLTKYMPEKNTLMSVWHQRICELAINSAHISVLKWLVQERNGQLLLDERQDCVSLEVFRWLYEHERHLPVCYTVQADATVETIQWCKAVEEDTECSLSIKWPWIGFLLQNGGNLIFLERLQPFEPERNALETAIRHGHLDIAKWLDRTFGKHYFLDFGTYECYCNKYNLCFLCQWKRADLELVEWVFSQLEWKDTNTRTARLKKVLIVAASQGESNAFDFIYQELRKSDKRQSLHGLGPQCFDAAAAHGHLSIVKRLLDRDQLCTEMAMDRAARNGHMEVVQWLHHNRSEGCTTDAMNGAAEFGHLGIVQWLHENRTEGCTVRAIDYAANQGHLHVVQWLHENRTEGCTTLAMDIAARNGLLEVIKWLHENRTEGCSTQAMDEAAKGGHLEILQWLHANRLEGYSDHVLDHAYTYDHLDVCRWLHENTDAICHEFVFSSLGVHAFYSPDRLDVIEYATSVSDCIELGLATDILIENGRFAAVESLIQKRGRASIESQHLN